jgi:YggT family protein
VTPVNALLALVGLVLVLFELLLIVRVVVDLVGSLASPEARYEGLGAVRRVVRPVRLGGVSFDIALTLVFVAVIVLRQLVLVA